MPKILGVIPSRYASSRFPAKALADILGKPMIQHVYERANKSNYLDELIVATDHPKIEEVVKGFGGKVIMTSENHPSGTDRCAEVADKLDKDFDYLINIQGDEPFVHFEQIDDIAQQLDGEVQLATLVKKIKTIRELFDPNSTKTVFDSNQNALYFSRSPIPFNRDHGQEDWVKHYQYWEQVGIYAYRLDVLKQITDLEVSPLEKAESLEQLRWMENGFTIRVGKTEHDSYCIDTPEDLERLLNRLKESKDLLD